MKKVICFFLVLLSFSFGSITTVMIPKGSSASEIAIILKKDKIISNEFTFNLLVKLFNKERNFLYGRLSVNPKASYLNIINQLQDPTNIQLVKVTIPEGFNLFQVNDLLVKKGLFKNTEFYDFATDKTKFIHLLKDIPELYNDPELTQLEGFLFPETYLFEYDITPEEIAQAMLSLFKSKVMPAYENAKMNETLPKRHGQTLKFYNIISLASIIEGEAVVPEERAMISGVFINRMNKRMILGSCATIHYARALNGLPKVIDLSFTDTRINSGYNTYTNQGLPPSAINNPGLASIEAALNPEKINYYFFISNKDGTHHFSTTEWEHNYWKRKYYTK